MICGAFSLVEAGVEDDGRFVGEVGIVAPCTQLVISDGGCVALTLAAVGVSHLQADSNRQRTRMVERPILLDIEQAVDVFPSFVLVT
jgi:hypothetical protein